MNDLPAMVRESGAQSRFHLLHCRTVQRTASRDVHEVAHPSASGDVDMRGVLQSPGDVGFACPMRPDHGRMIWRETGKPGCGLHHRALGAMYLPGLWRGIAH